MVNAVVVHELQIHGGGHIEHAVEVDCSSELIAAHVREFGNTGGDFLVEPGGDILAGFHIGRHLALRQLKAVSNNAIDEPDVHGGNVPGQFNGRLRLGVWLIVVVLVWHCR